MLLLCCERCLRSIYRDTLDGSLIPWRPNQRHRRRAMSSYTVPLCAFADGGLGERAGRRAGPMRGKLASSRGILRDWVGRRVRDRRLLNRGSHTSMSGVRAPWIRHICTRLLGPLPVRVCHLFLPDFLRITVGHICAVLRILRPQGPRLYRIAHSSPASRPLQYLHCL